VHTHSDEMALPSDTEAGLLYLCSLFPREKFEGKLPAIVMKHQLYSVIHDKTTADRELVRRHAEGHLMVDHHSFPLLSFFIPPLLCSLLCYLPFPLSSSPPPPSMPCIFNSHPPLISLCFLSSILTPSSSPLPSLTSCFFSPPPSPDDPEG